MGVSKVTMRRLPDGSYQASDGVGTLCQVRYVYNGHDTLVILAEGSYTGAIFIRPVKAKCVLVLRTAAIRENDGQFYVTSRMDCFIHLEQMSVELLARTVQPLVGRAADYNFTETAAFLGALSRAAQRNKPGMHLLVDKLTKTDPVIRAEFLQTVDAIPNAPPGAGVVVADAMASDHHAAAAAHQSGPPRNAAAALVQPAGTSIAGSGPTAGHTAAGNPAAGHTASDGRTVPNPSVGPGQARRPQPPTLRR
jgi:hypothetical protein